MQQMIDVLGEAPMVNPWFAAQEGLLMGEDADITLDLKTLRKDMMLVVATGCARRHRARCPGRSPAQTALSAAVAQGWGDKDIGESARFFRHMGQKFG